MEQSDSTVFFGYLLVIHGTARYHGAFWLFCCHGVAPKGLLTFLGSLYQEVAKTTPGILVYRFERQTPPEIFFSLPFKNTVSSTSNAGFYLRNLQIALFCISCNISWKVS